MTRTNRDHSSPDPTWDEYSEGSIDSTDPYLYSLTDLIPHSPRTPTMSHHHHPLPTQPYPPPYPPTSHASHPSYNGAPGNGSHSHAHHHHHPSRQAQHVSNGPPLPPPPSGLAGPAILTSASAEPSAHMGNGHAAANGAHGTYPGHGGHHHNGSNNSAASASAMSPVARAAREKMDSVLSQLASANENTWMLIGAVAEQMQDQDRALAAFENALRHNPTSILGLNAVASIARSRDNFDKAIEYFQRMLNIKQDNGEVWGSMGHCLLMKDDLPKAYTAYQQALYHLPNPKEPKLWYGIGILYDRYGSFEHAEEAFSSVLKMDPNFEKANEIYFRLGIIYKHQRKFSSSLECFKYILDNPPRPLTTWDIWFQLGHVYEQDRDFDNARDAYMRVLSHQPDHAKVLQQLGWLYHQPGASFADQDKAVQYLTKSLETDGKEAQSWYLLGRAFMAGQRYNKAYEAYQQAVYRDGRNPTFWCSIGVLYYQINQYRDALDAYSRAIRLNPYISEVWFNLGSLYESCNNQITDAIDAYTRAADLDPGNTAIKQRLSMLQTAGATNGPLPPAPGPVDVHPSQYTAQPQASYPPGGTPHGSPSQPTADVVDGASGGRALPPPPTGDGSRPHSAAGPFRGGAAPPPLQHVDESRGSMSRHAPLAPMDTNDRAADPRAGDPYRDHPPPLGRFDGDVPSRRHNESTSSPRRRAAQLDGYGYPYRDREREEWERRNAAGGVPGGPLGPSPPRGGVIDRQPAALRHERGASRDIPPAYGRTSPYEEYRNGPSVRAPTPHGEARGVSPAPSSTSSRKRRDGERRDPRGSGKRSGSGEKKRSRESNGKASSEGVKAERHVDDDYDEGAADALMALHGDRPAPSPARTDLTSPTAPTGSKRPISPSVSPSQSTVKKPRGESILSAASPKNPAASVASPRPTSMASPMPSNLSGGKRMVIEVLNAPSIGSPSVRPGSAVGSPGISRSASMTGTNEEAPKAQVSAAIETPTVADESADTTAEMEATQPAASESAVTEPASAETVEKEASIAEEPMEGTETQPAVAETADTEMAAAEEPQETPNPAPEGSAPAEDTEESMEPAKDPSKEGAENMEVDKPATPPEASGQTEVMA